MAGTGKSALGGAATGASLGSTIPGIGTAIGAAVGAAVGTITSLFKSKKHYHLYYFETANCSWTFVMDGIPSQVNPIKKQYEGQGYKCTLVRNKGGKHTVAELIPKNPPAGTTCEVSSSGQAGGTNWLLIIGIIGGVFILFMFLKKRKRRK